jgi:chaperonin GroEL
VALERANDYPLVTKSGFVAVRDLHVGDRCSRLGVELVKDTITRLHYELGDGATTTSILTEAMAREAIRLLAAGMDAGTLVGAFDAAESTAIDAFSRMRREVAGGEELAAVVLRACGGEDPQLATLVADAVERVGQIGIVTVSYHQAVATSVEYASGMEFDHGVLSRDFLDDGSPRRLDRPLLLLCEDALEEAGDVIPALEMARARSRALLVIAESVTKQAMATLLSNNRAGVVACAAVKGPGSGVYRHEMTADIAIWSGGLVLGRRLGRSPDGARIEDLGGCALATVGGRSTRLLEGEGDAAAVAAVVQQLRHEHAREQRHYDRSKLAMRLARLAAEVANIRVGGFTETEWKLRHVRAESMVAIARSAVSGGIVPGGGVALMQAAAAVRNACGEHPAAVAYARALRAPFDRLVRAAGLHPQTVAEAVNVLGPGAGFDQRTATLVPDAVAHRLMDPLPIVAGALRAASSIAKQLAKVNCAVVVADDGGNRSRSHYRANESVQ